MRAHIRDGRIVLDEQIDLPEGAAVEVLVPDTDAEIDRGELDAEADASAAEFDRGECEDARTFAARLAAPKP